MYILLLADGAGGKGTWGKLLDTDDDSHTDRNDPNYDSGEVITILSWTSFSDIVYDCPI